MNHIYRAIESPGLMIIFQDRQSINVNETSNELQ